MFSRLTNYIEDKEFRLTMYTYKLHIINYKEILSLNDNEISILTNKGKVIVKGSDLTLIKLVEQEVLINGKILNIEVYFND